ncbi:hypothetical protein IAD21_01704 [Abditibacteriota bacterium]|nr:hypothetical protein IAD21_01704 [Abditibacteriota bacterium]
MRLTQRASLLIVVALCFYLVAVVNSLQSFYYVLVWLAVGLLAACLGIALLSLTGTDCVLRERRVSGYARGELEGNKASPQWEASLGNSGSLNKTGLTLEFRLRRQEEGGATRKKNSLVVSRFLVEALPAGAKLTAPLDLDFLPRGIYVLEGARLIGSDVLGLFRASKRLTLPETPLKVVVAPVALPLALKHDFVRGVGGQEGPLSMSRLGTGEDLRGVRSYVPGDDWRHVHWATTARTGELSVREFERNGRDAALVIWDGALSASPSRGSQTTTEDELCLVTSLLVAIDTRRTPVSLMALGGEEEKISASGQEGLLAREALAALARAQPQRTRPLATVLAHAQGTGNEGSGQVFLVSSSLQSDLVECVSALTARGESLVVALCELRPHNVLRLSLPGRSVLPSAFEAQEKALQMAGARVVTVLLGEGEPAPVVLERALFEILEPQ